MEADALPHVFERFDQAGGPTQWRDGLALFHDTFWNVPFCAQLFLYLGGIVAIAVFAYGMRQRIRQ